MKSAKAALECRVFECIDLPSPATGGENHVVVGTVIGIHIDDGVIVAGKVDETRLQPLSRLGYCNYGKTSDVFELLRPD